MCVIIVKPKGKVISKEIFSQCWEKNSDGGGFAVWSGEKWLYQKGFMWRGSFWNAVKEVNKEDYQVVLHFRIATHGGINQETTHPFPLSQDYNHMRKLSGAEDILIFHNGTFSGFGERGGRWKEWDTEKKAWIYTKKGTEKVSDTMEFIRLVLYPYITGGFWKELEEVYKKEWSSRLAICREEGKVELLGEWKEEEGLYFSNSHWKPILKKHDNWEWTGSGWRVKDAVKAKMKTKKKKKRAMRYCYYCAKYTEPHSVYTATCSECGLPYHWGRRDW